MQSLSFLGSLDITGLVFLFWYTTFLEIPRYLVGAFAVVTAALWSPPRRCGETGLTISVVLPGHNEANSLRVCVEALTEQTVAADRSRMQIIVVDDGSTDRMTEVARELLGEGKIDRVLRLEHRGGKSAAVNFGLTACTGDIVVIADVDTSFDRDAFAILLSYFSDPRVGAVGGDIAARNAFATLITRHQTIEYAIGLSLGRRIGDMFGTLPIVSGAFGAFRRSALDSVGGQDVEVGEDADLTMKLRRAGWRIRFAPEAHALTLVPETVPALIAQRLRWDRGLVTIWLRKFRGATDPRAAIFSIKEVATFADVVVFQILLALAFPVYLVWLFYHFGEFSAVIIGATLAGYVVLDLLAFVAAAAIGLRRPLRLLPYLPLHSVLQVSLMRIVRLVAIVQELVFRSSYRDPYVPARVMQQVERV